MRTWFTIVAAGLLLAGCAQNNEYSYETHTWKTNQGTMALDHVSGHKVETSKAVSRQYLGETYYFENETNASKFDTNPWGYLYTDNVELDDRPDRVDQN
jgi:YHS domain-containing protein